MASLPSVAIIELGSQYTLVIERTLRELGVRSIIVEPKKALAWLRNNPVKAIILSGGAASVYDHDAPQPPTGIINLLQENGRPVSILGICYGMQWLVQTLGGEVVANDRNREYGLVTINQHDMQDMPGGPLEGTPREQTVWMSHGDSIRSMPNGFITLAYSETGAIAAIRKANIWGVQFHPEVTHTPHGKEVLTSFLKFAGCAKDWQPSSIIRDIRAKLNEEIGDRRAIIGFSGGVDSTTMAAIAVRVLSDQLLAITIDGGHLREGELDAIEVHATAAGARQFHVVDAKQEFQEALAELTDAEAKRRAFKRVYQAIFIREAAAFGAKFAIQGTLAPDRIESGVTGGALIKSHHNVGLDMGELIQLHPIDHLFKYEVRALALSMGLPESVCRRQPFPGPGLFLRVIGTPATPEMLDLVRWADERVREILIRHDCYNNISQLVVAYADIKTVGVKGDGRVYGGVILVRGVHTVDFMTVRGFYPPEEAAREIARVLTRHPQIVRMFIDPTDKPPATTEFE